MIYKTRKKRTFREVVHDSCAQIYHAAGVDALRMVQRKLEDTESPDDCLYLLAKLSRDVTEKT
jgi:hypothetical protein